MLLSKRIIGVINISLLVIILLVSASSCQSKKTAKSSIILGTTTDLYDSGIIDSLIKEFEEKESVKVKVVATDSSDAIKKGQQGDIDVLLLNSDELDPFVDDGYGVDKGAVFRDDYIIIGPASDPAEAKGLKTGEDVLRKIAGAQSAFLSRGDNSDNHNKELEIWFGAGITPDGPWYETTGLDMTETTKMADEKKAYILIDRATYTKLKNKLKLGIILENSDDLINLYSIVRLDPKKYPRVKSTEATRFIDWITSSEARALINEATNG